MRISFGGALLSALLLASTVAVVAMAQTNDTVKARMVNCGPTPSTACLHDWIPPYGAVVIADAQSSKGPQFCPPDRNAQDNVAAVIAWLQKHPETWSEIPRDGVAKALRALYPCR